MSDWANLPFELLESIALHLASVDDFTAFSAVCKSWHSVWSELKEKIILPPRLPWLILAEDQDNQQIRPIFSLSNSKTYEIKLPEASRTNCVAANYGWIFTLSPDLQINLLHPFSRIQIPLPSMLGFSDQYNYDEEFKPEGVAHMFVTKAVLSRNPRDEEKGEWVIVAIYGQFRILGFAREGDKVWTDIPCPSRCYEDVVFYEGKFYAVDCHGIVIVCEIDDPKSTVIAPAPVGTRDEIKSILLNHQEIYC